MGFPGLMVLSGFQTQGAWAPGARNYTVTVPLQTGKTTEEESRTNQENFVG